MKLHLWAMGAPSDGWISDGEKLYCKRIEHYLPFEYKCYQAGKNSTNKISRLASEAKWLKEQFGKVKSKIIILDESGPQLTSRQFADRMEQWRQGAHKRVIFLIGSAYGFDQNVYEWADERLGLSLMTLPHQICRIVLLEQIYRACTILKGESYHHDG